MTEPNEQIVRHSDREIARILHHAAELQQQDRERGAVATDPAAGLSLDELKLIAAEVGIEARYVEAAAADVHQGGKNRRRFFFWGAPASSEVEQVVNGEVTEEQWDTLLATIRRSTGNSGQPSALGRTLEWRGELDHVSISPRNGQTHMRLMSNNLARILPMHLPPGMLSFIFTFAIAKGQGVAPLEALALGAAATGSVFALARGLVGYLCRRKTRQMQELLRELADQVAQGAPSTHQEAALAAPLTAAHEPARLDATEEWQPDPARLEAQPPTDQVRLGVSSTRSKNTP
jgi:hypothetical protein